tara:strand:- start:402 stop:1142 length:741 start_codon:yes stop_codon:yes gene_type:complete
VKVLVLGHEGMLGHTVKNYISGKDDCDVEVIFDRWPSDSFKERIQLFEGDVIVNCIGAIPQRKVLFGVNYKLPIWLDSNSPCNVIHPGTDCEADKDPYGESKYKAFEYLKTQGAKTKIIKCSIIGHEVNSKHSLLDWFLSCKDRSVKGYTKCMWNGITTLQWAKICYGVAKNFEDYEFVSTPATECISKAELLNVMKEVYSKNIIVVGDDSKVLDKCLVGDIEVPDIKSQLKELKQFFLCLEAGMF